ncbi:MAG TPA: hypothetical protein VHY20_01305, partial [Pirellulales bacterium]|nr:hypothetical protein [Pirellulales bacterium]
MHNSNSTAAVRQGRRIGAAARAPRPLGAEFDQYAAGYGAGMENPLKQLAGNSAEEFIDVKVRWLLKRENQRGKT